MESRSIPQDAAPVREHPYAKPMPGDDVPDVLGSSLPLADAGPPALAGAPSLET
jgi:hypothetical protein